MNRLEVLKLKVFNWDKLKDKTKIETWPLVRENRLLFDEETREYLRENSFPIRYKPGER